MARRLYTLKNAIRENKTDPVDARGLCAVAALHGAELLQKYRFRIEPERMARQRLHTVRKAVRTALTKLKKTSTSLLDLSFPELGKLMQLDGAGLARPPPGRRPLRPPSLANASPPSSETGGCAPRPRNAKRSRPTPFADPDLAAASAPALRGLLHAIAELENRLAQLDRQIEQLALQAAAPARQRAHPERPRLWPATAAKLVAYLPEELLQSGSNRTAATRLQAFMGNDPRLKQSGQFKGQTRMSKRGVAPLRTAFFQAAFSASQHDPELKACDQRKRAQGKEHEVALSHLMRILTRRLVAVLRSQQPYRPQEFAPPQKCRLKPLTPVIACLHRLVRRCGVAIRAFCALG